MKINLFLQNGLKLFSSCVIFLFLLTACGSQNAVSLDEKQYILKFKREVEEDRKLVVMSELRLIQVKQLDFIDAVVCQYQGDLAPAELLQKSKDFLEIEYLEPDFEVHIEK